MSLYSDLPNILCNVGCLGFFFFGVCCLKVQDPSPAGFETLCILTAGCGCLIIGNVQGQVGRGFKKPDLVKDVPADDRDSWTRISLKVPSNSKHSMVLSPI